MGEDHIKSDQIRSDSLKKMYMVDTIMKSLMNFVLVNENNKLEKEKKARTSSSFPMWITFVIALSEIVASYYYYYYYSRYCCCCYCFALLPRSCSKVLVHTSVSLSRNSCDFALLSQ